MRGSDQHSGRLFAYVNLESRIAPDHPLRLIREIANEALAKLNKAFEELYSREGR
ncbi:MAG TPA: IS5/IS1182 family transposase, partial [Burkholderiales bacterium]|nr:IS5/IS1182 family transposase [Burkholderiales bacterium]